MYIQQKPSSPEALFRFMALSRVYFLESQQYSRAEAIRCTCSEAVYDENAVCRKVKERTLYRWLQKAEEGKKAGLSILESLEPVKRETIEGSTVLSRDFLEFCKMQKELDGLASVPELIKRARLEGFAEASKADRSTVYRALKRMGVCVQKRKSSGPASEMRRFAFPHRMQCVLCDGKHFRAGPNRLKRVALIFIDDATRFVLDAFVSTSENRWIFNHGLYEVVRKYGIMDQLYLDHGPGFIATETKQVVANFSHLVHGKVKFPQGHGKVERFNQTLKKDVLRTLSGSPIDPDCEHLRLRILHYLKNDYNVSPHESLGGQTPRECFLADSRELNFPENEAALRNSFIVSLKRLVSWDNIVKVHRKEYEVPLGYAGSYVYIQLQMYDKSLHFLHRDEFVELQEVDKVENAYRHRATKKKKSKETHHVKTAAQTAFDNDYSPITDRDGGFPKEKGLK